MTTTKCGYCRQPQDGTGWHDCPQAIRGRKRLGDALVNIHELMVGGPEPVTGHTHMEEYWNQKQRDKELETVRTQIHITKGSK